MSPLVLSAQNNVNYGGNLVTQKYSPLENVQVSVPYALGYETLFANRRGALGDANAYPPQLNTLTYYRVNPPAVVAGTAPMVVVSSGRAEWLQYVLQNAVDHGPFTGYLENNTFQSGSSSVPVAWFAPDRSGRQLYVVVHHSEYDYYQARLAQFPNVAVFGYKFSAARPALDIVGFGASRFAALQLMIHLGYHQAWAVDDNVINVNGFPDALATVENLMPLPGTIWGLGFGAATSNINTISNQTVVFQNNVTGLANTAPGLLQQVVLWNLDLLGPARINFSPLFVSSNEDVSLSNYLQATHRDERIITQCRVVKFEPFPDPGSGPDSNLGAFTTIPIHRNRMLALFSAGEARTAINPGGGEVALQDFICNTVLPASRQPVSTFLTAQSRAIEQVLSAATLQGWVPAAPAMPFDPYNGAPNIQMLDAAHL